MSDEWAGGLEQLALGELSRDQAIQVVTDAIGVGDEDLAVASYEALRSLTWKLLTGRIYGAEMRDWHDLMRQAASSLSVTGKTPLSERVRTLAELVLESARFGEVHSSAELLSKPHVQSILKAIRARGGEARRQGIMAATGLRQSNLSRFLSSMSALGLVERRQHGREVMLRLTDAEPRPGTSQTHLNVSPPFASAR
jgi:DNA-binding transcriptional ArsR family regulator